MWADLEINFRRLFLKKYFPTFRFMAELRSKDDGVWFRKFCFLPRRSAMSGKFILFELAYTKRDCNLIYLLDPVIRLQSWRTWVTVEEYLILTLRGKA